MFRLYFGIIVGALFMMSCSGGLFSENSPSGKQFNSDAIPTVTVEADVEKGTPDEPNSEDIIEKGEESKDDKTDTAYTGKCDKKLSDKKPVKLNGNQSQLEVTTEEFFEAKVNGNLSHLKLTLSSENPEAKLSGACLFLTGNQSSAEIIVGANVGLIQIITRGNQAKVNIEVADGFAVDTLQLDQKGSVVEVSTSGDIIEINN